MLQADEFLRREYLGGEKEDVDVIMVGNDLVNFLPDGGVGD